MGFTASIVGGPVFEAIRQTFGQDMLSQNARRANRRSLCEARKKTFFAFKLLKGNSFSIHNAAGRAAWAQDVRWAGESYVLFARTPRRSPLRYWSETSVQHKWFFMVLSVLVGMPSWFGFELPLRGESDAGQSYGRRAEGCPVFQTALVLSRISNPVRPALGHSKFQVQRVHGLHSCSNPNRSAPSQTNSRWESSRLMTLHASRVKLQI